jgi:hypothetical protein
MAPHLPPTTSTHDGAPERAARHDHPALLIAVGGVCGLAWAAGLRSPRRTLPDPFSGGQIVDVTRVGDADRIVDHWAAVHTTLHAPTARLAAPADTAA